MIDVHMLLKKLRRVEDDIEHLKTASSQAELIESMQRFGDSAHELMSQAGKRQFELKDPAMRDDLAAARAVLKKHSMMLLTASKAYVRHPELAAAKANRDYVLRQGMDTFMPLILIYILRVILSFRSPFSTLRISLKSSLLLNKIYSTDQIFFMTFQFQVSKVNF